MSLTEVHGRSVAGNLTKLTPSQNEMASQNIGLAVVVAFKLRKRMAPWLDQDETLSLANLALVQCCRAFNASLGFKLSASLHMAIRRMLLREREKSAAKSKITVVPLTGWNSPSYQQDVGEIRPAVVPSLLGKLDKRSRLVVTAYYGIGRNKRYTFKQLGKRLQITSQRVQQIHAMSLLKMKSFS